MIKEEVKERPILFTPEMATAIREGRKTVTRRVVKPQPLFLDDPWPNEESEKTFRDLLDTPLRSLGAFSPFGSGGDKLWVKENWKIVGWTDDVSLLTIAYSGGERRLLPVPDHETNLWFDRIMKYTEQIRKRPGISLDTKTGQISWDDDKSLPWKSSLFMPRWVSRTLLEVLPDETWLEPLQNISTEEARLEGVEDRIAFQKIWDGLRDGEGELGWDADPWVWRIGFKKIG